jgi:hypothetical protein
MTTPLPVGFVLPRPEDKSYLDTMASLFTCVRCHHDLADHGPAGSVPPSKSKCQSLDCPCSRFMREGDTE